MQGRVLQSTGSWYHVQTTNNDIVKCRIKGKFRLTKTKVTNPVAVGDRVTIEMEQGLSTGMITAIEKRQNYIIRQSPHKKHQRHIIASNIDQAVLIVTFSNPRTSLGFIDRFLLTAEMYHIPAAIIFNKYDIYTEKDQLKYEEASLVYESLGYTCLLVSAETGHNMEQFEALMQDKTSLVSGHSGVGKSTLLNVINPDLDLRTNDISQSSGKGMHTTTFAEMHQLSDATYVIDTPGIKEFGIVHIEPEEVGHYFREIQPLISECQFNNCLHRNEPNCAVKNAFIEEEIADFRYLNYLSMLENIEATNYWER